MGVKVTLPLGALNGLFAEAGQLGHIAEAYQQDGHPAGQSLGQVCNALSHLSPAPR